MRLSSILLSLAATCAVTIPLSAVAQQTQSSPAAAPVDPGARQALSEVQVRGQTRHHRLDSDEARQVAGTYAMSNGWIVHVIPRRDHVLMEINDGQPVQLFAQSADKFASADGSIATVFNLGMSREDVVMSYVPDARFSDQRVVIGTAALAAR